MSPSPAQRLDRLVLKNNWVVVGRAPYATERTGSSFSVGYVVEHAETGQKAFLKALDITDIIERVGEDDAPAAIREALEIHSFEVRVCERCRGLNRVVTFLESGSLRVDPTMPLSIVPYLIFEQAEGDVRAFLEVSRDLDLAWALRCMHHIATGLQQMHSRELAHQDIKPSNVLLFGREHAKLGDVGRAIDRRTAGPYDDDICAGALPYAPPELLYGQRAVEWGAYRLACDMYLLGSMLVFFTTGTTMTALLLENMQADTRPIRDGIGWSGDYKGVLPILQQSFARALDEFAINVPAALSSDLRTLLQRLCDPDPERRGNPKARAVPHGSPYDMQFFVSRFNALATRVEAKIGLSRHIRPMASGAVAS
jgi:serine/threonine protein kinase